MLTARSMPAQLASALLLTAALLLTSVGGVTAQDAAATPEGSEWQLTEQVLEGSLVPVPEGVEATLVLDAGSAGGNGGCNVFTAGYQLDGPAISFGGDIIRTQMFCEGDAQVVEDAYLAALPTVATWSLEEGVLRLLDADGAPILVFEAAAADGDSDLAAVVAALEALELRIGELEARVAGLEADGAPPEATPETASAPRAPRARGGRVETIFPDWMREPLPPTDPADRNRDIVRFRDRANDEDGFRIYARRGYCALKPGVDPEGEVNTSDFRDATSDFEVVRGELVQVADLRPDRRRFRPDHAAIDAALPVAPESRWSSDQFYDLFIASFNAAGESEPVLVGSFFLTPEFRCP